MSPQCFFPSRHSPPRKGFTLIELLVVIGILAILASLGVWAGYAALISMHESAISYEIQQLEQAVETYEDAHNDYFPDFSNDAAFDAHLRRFRRYTGGRPAYVDAANPQTSLDPAEALVFFLSRIRPNVQSPFPANVGDMSGSPLERFAFDKTRLSDYDGDGWLEYYPENGEQTPYVYFNNQTYAAAVYPPPAMVPPPLAGKGFATPYLSDLPTDPFVAPKKFQIISAGLDGVYDQNNPPLWNKSFPSGLNYTPADDDNITSFSEGSNLGDSRP